MEIKKLTDPKGLRKFVHSLRGLFASLILGPTLLFANSVQIASLPVRLFSQRAFRKIMRFGANLWWGWCVLWAEKLHRTKVIISGDDVPERENTIVVANHVEMTDIPVIFSLARRKKRLGDLKWFVKDIVKYVPGAGWGLLFLDCLFVKRDWTADREKINHVFHKILQHRIPLWLISFVEGTRLKPAKLMLSNSYIEKLKLPPLKYVMMPRTKGFVASVQSLRGHIDAVYDLTIGYIDGVPTLWQWIKGSAKRAHLHVRRFAVSELPEDTEALTAWLIERFQEKDRLLEHYYKYGMFPQNSLQLKPISLRQ